MISKSGRILAFAFMALCTLPERSHERYLLVELDGPSAFGRSGGISEVTDPAYVDCSEQPGGCTEETEGVQEETPIEDNSEQGSFTETPRRPNQKPSRRHKLKAFRSGKAPKGKAGKKGNGNPPITDPSKCTEENKCVSDAGGKPKKGSASGRWWSACGGYPVCYGGIWSACHYFYGGHRYCLWG